MRPNACKRYITDEEAVDYGYRKGLLKAGKGNAELVGHGIAMGWLRPAPPESQMTDAEINTAKCQKSKEKRKQGSV